MKQLSDYRRWTWNCFRDSQCKQVFPWHVTNADFYQICPSLARHRFDCFSAQGKMDLGRALVEKEIDWSDKLLDVIYQDPLCGACDYTCGRIKEMQPGRVIQAMRAQALRDGKTPPGGFQALLTAMRQYLNPYGKPDSDRNNWLRGIPRKLAGPTAASGPVGRTRTLLYTGCFPLRGSTAERMAQNAAAVLLTAGADVGILGERERCCGNPSLRMGDVDSFVAFARENIKMFHAMGVETLVTVCPFCYSAFKRDYPETGDIMEFEVVHIMELVDRLVKDDRLRFSRELDLTVTYHDPCHLGRLSGRGISGTGAFTGIYDQPRGIISALPGVKLVEMHRTRDDTWCCGAGGWLRNGYIDLARWTADRRIDEALTTGAGGLVTCCPHCEENLSEALQRRGDGMKMYDLLDLVRRAL